MPPPSRVTVGYLLQAWLAADHPWKPSTYVGYTSNARALTRDPIAARPAAALTPHEIRSRLAVWQATGATDAVLACRFRVLRACLTWACNERLLDGHPLRLMRGPRRSPPRQGLSRDEIQALLLAAELRVLEAAANLPTPLRPGLPEASGPVASVTSAAVASSAASRRLRVAEQDLLLVRLAADSGARRGELVALRFDDLNGRVLHIQRAISAGQVTTPKSGRGRTITLGADTADLWHHLRETWERRLAEDTPPSSSKAPVAATGSVDAEAATLGSWLFSADAAHHRRVGAEVIGHRFQVVREAAGVPGATLHRLRHSVATFLVAQGKILEAQERLGHGDASTTLREYSHVAPGRDGIVADAINDYLDLTQCSEDDHDRPATARTNPDDERFDG